MSTVIGIECGDGAVLGGDRTLTRAGEVVSTSKGRVFDFGDCGAAVVGDAGGIDEFERQFDAERREYEVERGSMGVETVARIASEVAEAAGVEAIVAGRDGSGEAEIRTVGSDGSVLDDPTAALGTGASIAQGRLETIDRDSDRNLDLEEGASLVRDILGTVAERDAETGEEIDVYRLRGAAE